MTSLKRFRQGVLALTAFARPVDYAAVDNVLTPELAGLFRRMTRSEQHHSLRVMSTLRDAGHDHPELLTAALLHDVGKSRVGMTLPERTAVVLVRKFTPSLAVAWAHGEPRGFRRAFVVSARHADWSAEDIAALGASPLAVELVRRHQEPPITAPATESDRLLAILQTADDNE